MFCFFFVILLLISSFDIDAFPCFRMPKLQPFRMQIEPFGRLSVEGIAHDGAVQAIGVGGMDTELVGAARLGPEGDTGTVVDGF